MKKLILGVLPFLAFAMTACQRNNGNSSSSTVASSGDESIVDDSSEEDVSEDSVESSEEESSEEESSEAGDSYVIHFKDASWWNADAASTRYSIDGGDDTLMTYDTEKGYVGGVNYWSVEVPADAVSIVFKRYGDELHPDEHWGAETVSITLADRGENDMYDISGTSAAWKGDGNYVTGEWGVYPTA